MAEILVDKCMLNTILIIIPQKLPQERYHKFTQTLARFSRFLFSVPEEKIIQLGDHTDRYVYPEGTDSFEQFRDDGNSQTNGHFYFLISGQVIIN